MSRWALNGQEWENREAELHLRALPEDDGSLQVFLRVSNGMYAGAIDFYCNPSDLHELGAALQRFPRKVPDEHVYTYGSSDPAVRFYRHLVIRAWTTDGAGHVALQFVLNQNQPSPNDGQCRFSVPLSRSALEELGQLFCGVGEKNTSSFSWHYPPVEF